MMQNRNEAYNRQRPQLCGETLVHPDRRDEDKSRHHLVLLDSRPPSHIDNFFELVEQRIAHTRPRATAR